MKTNQQANTMINPQLVVWLDYSEGLLFKGGDATALLGLLPRAVPVKKDYKAANNISLAGEDECPSFGSKFELVMTDVCLSEGYRKMSERLNEALEKIEKHSALIEAAEQLQGDPTA